MAVKNHFRCRTLSRLSPLSILFLSLPWLSLLWPAFADEVILHNGDRLTGDVLRQEGSELLLMTDYAGEIKIDWAQVREVRLDEPAPALLENNEVIEIAAVTREADRLRIRQPSPRTPISLPPEHVQIIEPEPWEIGEGYHLSGIVNLGLQDATGNSPSTELDLDFELNYQRRWQEWQTYGQLEYDTTDGVKTTENWTSLNKYSRRFPRSPWYGSAWLRFKHDRFADLRLRSIVGPAIGYQFDGSANTRLSAEVGPVYLREDFYDQRDNLSWGTGVFIDYEQDLIADRLQFYLNGMGFSAFTGETKDLWVSWAGLRVPLIGGFVGSLEYEIDYDGQPAEDTKTTDQTLRLKLGYQW
jgi:putative salt-induced outer membrane protein YdiY